MSDVEIILKSPDGPQNQKSWRLSLPADIGVKEIITALIPKLGLPSQYQSHPIHYYLYHVQSDKIISDTETLDSAGVENSDTCILMRDHSTPQRKAPPPEPESLNLPWDDLLQEPIPVVILPTLKYTYHHTWIDIDMPSKIGKVGITELLAQSIFSILDVELPEVGIPVTAGETVSLIWAFTESIDEFEMSIPAPVSGVISATNKNLVDRFLRPGDPDIICEDPYGEGWLFTIEISEAGEHDLHNLLDAEAYSEFVQSILEE
ncbi:MAG: hypothetical protein PVF58_12855 [Candidatus Methanofastidiosia archaeon]